MGRLFGLEASSDRDAGEGGSDDVVSEGARTGIGERERCVRSVL